MRSRKKYPFFGWRTPPVETSALLASGAVAMALILQPLSRSYGTGPIATANLMVDVAMNTYAPVEDITDALARSGTEVSRAAHSKPGATIPGGVLILDNDSLRFFPYESEDARRIARENRFITARLSRASTLDESIDALGGMITRKRLEHQNMSYEVNYGTLDEKSAALERVRQKVPSQESRLWSVVDGIAANFTTIPADFIMRQEDYARAIQQYGPSGRVIGTWRTMGPTQGRDDAQEMQLPNEYTLILRRGAVNGEERIRVDIYFSGKHQVLVMPATDTTASLDAQGF